MRKKIKPDKDIVSKILEIMGFLALFIAYFSFALWGYYYVTYLEETSLNTLELILYAKYANTNESICKDYYIPTLDKEIERCVIINDNTYCRDEEGCLNPYEYFKEKRRNRE